MKRMEPDAYYDSPQFYLIEAPYIQPTAGAKTEPGAKIINEVSYSAVKEAMAEHLGDNSNTDTEANQSNVDGDLEALNVPHVKICAMDEDRVVAFLEISRCGDSFLIDVRGRTKSYRYENLEVVPIMLDLLTNEKVFTVTRHDNNIYCVTKSKSSEIAAKHAHSLLHM